MGLGLRSLLVHLHVWKAKHRARIVRRRPRAITQVATSSLALEPRQSGRRVDGVDVRVKWIESATALRAEHGMAPLWARLHHVAPVCVSPCRCILVAKLFPSLVRFDSTAEMLFFTPLEFS